MVKNIIEFNKIVVIRIDLENFQERIKVDPSYSTALLVFSYKNSLLGQTLSRVNKGIINIPKTEEIVSNFYQSMWSSFISSKVKNDYNPFVSVVICSHNRADELQDCLNSLLDLKYINKEIIIVDNAPVNNDTKELVLSYKDFIYICEPRKGLDIARNRGIKESKGEIIAFTDDDAIVDSLWLDNIVKNFRAPLVCVVTGITLPYELETEAQIIFEFTNSFKRGFIRKEFSFSNLEPIGAGNVGAGVNMSVRRKYLNEVGLFDESLDGGTYTLSGGDQEFFYRVLAKGYNIVYEPDALVWHKHRRDINSLKKTIYGYGVGVSAWWSKAVFKKKEIASIFFMIKWFVLYYVLNLFRAILKKKSLQFLELSLLEFLGVLYGPIAYLRAYSFSKTNKKLLEKKLTNVR